MQDILALLRGVDLFAALDAETLAALVRAAREVDCNPGQLIWSEGEDGAALYVILDGEVQTYKTSRSGGEVVLARCGVGQSLGAQALISGPAREQIRMTNARALGAARLWRLERSAFQAALPVGHPLKDVTPRIGDRQLLDGLNMQSRLFRALDLGKTNADERRFEKGDVIFRQGDSADFLYLILEGAVSLFQDDGGEETLLSTLESGQCFGELGLGARAPRLATARAVQNSRLMLVPAVHYETRLAQSKELADLFGTLQRVYKLPRRGRLIQSTGTFLGRETITNLYELGDGKKAVVSRVIGADLYNADAVLEPTAKPTMKTLIYADEARQLRRELRIAEGPGGVNRLVGLTVHGAWPVLAELQARLLEGTPFPPDLYARFESSGRLKYEETTMSSTILCRCIHVEKRAVKRAIRNGCTRLNVLQDQLGCGTVCGTCLPNIKHLLGNEQWSPVRIIEERQVTSDIRQLRLRPSGQPVATALPGQHIVLSGLIAGEWVQRAYTLTSASGEADHYEIMVKREKSGIFSRWLFSEAGDDAFLRVSPPQGEYIWKPTGKPVVCLVAGIGVTPALSILRSRLRQGIKDRLHIDYSARTEQGLVCAAELQAAAQRDPGISINLRVTSSAGHIEVQEIKALHARFADAQYFLCGPRSFMDAVAIGLRQAGVRAANINIESFAPASERPGATSPAAQQVGPAAAEAEAVARPASSVFGFVSRLFRKK